MPGLENRISVGNLLTIAAALASAGIAWGATRAELQAMRAGIDHQAKTIQEGRIERTQALAGHEARLRTLEAGAARDGATLDAIRQSLARIEARLDRSEGR